MAEIFGFLKMLPTLLGFCIEAKKFLDHSLGVDPESKLKAITDAFRGLREAKTTEDRANAADKISNIISKL